MWKIQYLLSVLSFLLAIVLISRLLRERRAPGSTIAWLMVMTLIPHLGVPLFLILGNRKIKRARDLKSDVHKGTPPVSTPGRTLPMERMLLASGVPPKSNGNDVTVLSSGEEAYRALLQTLQEARHKIFISTYILSLDPVGKSILKLLEEKARAGIQVRLLLDGLGSFWTFRWRLRAFCEAGGKVSHFLPLIHVPFFGHSNLRNHRKLVIVDGKTAILGGMNLAREYMGSEQNQKCWVDLSVRISGPEVSNLESLFLADWLFSFGENLAPATSPSLTEKGAQTVQVVASGPDVPGDPLYDSIVSAIFDAKERVWVATPYYIPDDTLSKALELASKRGVDVRLLIPKNSNHFLADLCRGGYLKQLEKAGGKIFYYTDSMMHAKAVIIDDLYAVVGSANFDMRSLLLNYELGFFLYSPTGIQAVSQWYETLLARSIREPIKKQRGSAFLEGVGRIMGPML
jgi:cardiolipin synthase